MTIQIDTTNPEVSLKNLLMKMVNNDESIRSSIISEEEIWLNGCRDVFIIDKLKPNSKSNIKEQKLSSNNLDKALHDAHILNNLQN